MKKRNFILCLLALTLVLAGCGGNQKNTEKDDEAFTPLFRLALKGEAEETRLSYLPKSRGFVYLTPGGEGGYSVGFVSPSRSVSSEGIITATEPATFFQVKETQEDRALILTPQGLSLCLLKENRATTTALPEGIDLSGALFFDSLSLLCETEDLVLLCPVDFSQKYVLAQKANFPDFDSLLAVTGNGQRIWYTLRGEGDAFGGIAFFEYGKSIPLGREEFSFHRVQSLGDGKVLFIRDLEDGKELYFYRDLESGTTLSLPPDVSLEKVTCNADGTVLCGSERGEKGAVIHIFDLETGKEVGTFHSAMGKDGVSLCLSRDGSTLLLGLRTGQEEVIGSLDVAQYR